MGVLMNRRNLLATGLASGLAAATSPLWAAPQQSDGRDAFFVPPEEAPHHSCFMQWPNSRRVYPDPIFLEMTQQVIADIANAISDFEPVTMLAAQSQHAAARRKLSQAVTLWDIPTEDLWCRDSGPIFVTDGKGSLALRRIQFNGWGNKQRHKHDSRIAEKVANRLGLPLLESGLTGEAGGVEQDGHGVLIAHESSWVNANRNPGLTRREIEQRLLGAYGANRMIWSKGLWGEDITDYHIDSLARFTGPGRVLINLPKRPDLQDPFHRAALETHYRIAAAGMEIEVIPEPVFRRVRSLDFVASYANYYVCNGAVIAAQFGDAETDAIARAALQRHYPGREIRMLNVDPLGELGGGIHCATQQMPAV